MVGKHLWHGRSRLSGLRRFALAITTLNVLGHTVLGFEQSIAQPLVALAMAYVLEFVLELINARTTGRPPRYKGGFVALVDFFLSAHISALAVSMLLYSNDRLLPIMFGTAVAIASKTILRVQVGAGSRHFMNPSNFGITATLLLFPWVGIAPPYHFTEGVSGVGNWVFVGIVITLGTLLNAKYTKRLPLIGAWLLAFVAQALIRNVFFDASLTAALMPMTGIAFLLFTFYMVSDPATTPGTVRGQLLFGGSVAIGYGLLMVSHVVFGLFFALTAVCTVRGVSMYLAEAKVRKAQAVGESESATSKMAPAMPAMQSTSRSPGRAEPTLAGESSP